MRCKIQRPRSRRKLGQLLPSLAQCYLTCAQQDSKVSEAGDVTNLIQQLDVSMDDVVLSANTELMAAESVDTLRTRHTTAHRGAPSSSLSTYSPSRASHSQSISKSQSQTHSRGNSPSYQINSGVTGFSHHTDIHADYTQFQMPVFTSGCRWQSTFGHRNLLLEAPHSDIHSEQITSATSNHTSEQTDTQTDGETLLSRLRNAVEHSRLSGFNNRIPFLTNEERELDVQMDENNQSEISFGEINPPQRFTFQFQRIPYQSPEACNGLGFDRGGLHVFGRGRLLSRRMPGLNAYFNMGDTAPEASVIDSPTSESSDRYVLTTTAMDDHSIRNSASDDHLSENSASSGHSTKSSAKNNPAIRMNPDCGQVSVSDDASNRTSQRSSSLSYDSTYFDNYCALDKDNDRRSEKENKTNIDSDSNSDSISNAIFSACRSDCSSELRSSHGIDGRVNAVGEVTLLHETCGQSSLTRDDTASSVKVLEEIMDTANEAEASGSAREQTELPTATAIRIATLSNLQSQTARVSESPIGLAVESAECCTAAAENRSVAADVTLSRPVVSETTVLTNSVLLFPLQNTSTRSSLASSHLSSSQESDSNETSDNISVSIQSNFDYSELGDSISISANNFDFSELDTAHSNNDNNELYMPHNEDIVEQFVLNRRHGPVQRRYRRHSDPFGSRSSASSNESAGVENWYYYDPRLRPSRSIEVNSGNPAVDDMTALLSYLQALRNLRTPVVFNPPSYEDTVATLEDQWEDGPRLAGDTLPSPPPYLDNNASNEASNEVSNEPALPPSYEQALLESGGEFAMGIRRGSHNSASSSVRSSAPSYQSVEELGVDFLGAIRDSTSNSIRSSAPSYESGNAEDFIETLSVGNTEENESSNFVIANNSRENEVRDWRIGIIRENDRNEMTFIRSTREGEDSDFLVVGNAREGEVSDWLIGRDGVTNEVAASLAHSTPGGGGSRLFGGMPAVRWNRNMQVNRWGSRQSWVAS